MRDEWGLLPLKELVEVDRTRVDPRKMTGSLTHYSIPALDSSGAAIEEPAESIKSHKFRVLQDSVLVSLLNPRIPRWVRAEGTQNSVCSTEFAVLRPSERSPLTFDFLEVLASSADFWERLDRLTSGTTGSRKRVKLENFLSLTVHVPPEREQRRIVDLVSSIDTVIARGDTYVVSARALSNSIIRTEYGGDGKTVTLGSLCGDSGIQIGPFGSQLHQSDYTEGGVPVVMPANMKDGMIQEEGIARIPESKAEELRRHRLLPGDILLPRRGDLSKRALVEKKHEGWLCGTGSARVRVSSGVNPEAVYRAISAPSATRWLYENAVGTTMPNLNTTIVSNLPLRFPPDPGAPLSSLRALDEAISRAVELVSSLRGWRRSCLASLLSGTRAIPDSYDRFLEEAS